MSDIPLEELHVTIWGPLNASGVVVMVVTHAPTGIVAQGSAADRGRLQAELIRRIEREIEERNKPDRWADYTDEEQDEIGHSMDGLPCEYYGFDDYTWEDTVLRIAEIVRAARERRAQ